MLLLTPVNCPYDVTGDGYIDESDVAAIYAAAASSQACPVGVICIWDVNFDCRVTRADVDIVLEFIAACSEAPCPYGEARAWPPRRVADCRRRDSPRPSRNTLT